MHDSRRRPCTVVEVGHSAVHLGNVLHAARLDLIMLLKNIKNRMSMTLLPLATAAHAHKFGIYNKQKFTHILTSADSFIIENLFNGINFMARLTGPPYRCQSKVFGIYIANQKAKSLIAQVIFCSAHAYPQVGYNFLLIRFSINGVAGPRHRS